MQLWLYTIMQSSHGHKVATYEFEVLNMDGMWKDVGGVYIFSGEKDNSWRAYYIGVTDSFQDRHPNPERWEEAKRLGPPMFMRGGVAGGHPGVN